MPRTFRAARIRFVVAAAAVALGLASLAPVADACRVVEVELTPTPSLQMVIWLEDASGTYVDTLFITQAVGTYGLGNRPGLYNYNSGDWWPYGRRESVFPIWAHKRNHQYPLLVFQDRQDDNLSHSLSQSSQEQRYCRPTLESEIHGMDMMTCPTLRAYTDKGMFDPMGKKSLYPPRNDLVDPRTPAEGGVDHENAKMFAQLNDLDSISRPTPPPGMSYRVRWNIPDSLPMGMYKVRVEVSKERDRNPSYSQASPVLLSWGEYGVPSLGQPSVLWEVPIAIDATARKALTLNYAGYGDPDGSDGLVSPPDGTITVGMEGSGAGRLAMASDAGDMFRVKVSTQPTGDTLPPGMPSMLQATEIKADRATVEFLAPGGDGDTGMISGFEVRMRAGAPIVTEADFRAADLVQVSTDHTNAGAKKTITLTGLLPRTNYFVAVRASDDCLNLGPIATLKITTPETIVDPTDPGGGCFIATAAWGSLLAPKVVMLRAFRDRVLRKSFFGQTFITVYYSFSPALADTIRPYPTLRAMARGGLGPVIDLAEAALQRSE